MQCLGIKVSTNEVGPVTGRSLLDTMLLELWEDCAEKGLFRYDVTACATKVGVVMGCGCECMHACCWHCGRTAQRTSCSAVI
mgnify:CR=1 FL=1